MPTDDAWDWPTLLYVATTLLNRSEAQFWRMTPRKFRALTKVHMEMNNIDENSKSDEKSQAGFIDQVI